MIQIPLTPDKYQAALDKLQNERALELSLIAGPNGHILITVPQVTIACLYNGSDTLNVTVIEKRGIAKFASDNTIKAHLEDLLTGV